MADATSTTRFRFWLWLIKLIGVIVPRRLRTDWRQEWEAELHHREAMLADWDRLNWRNKLDLLQRSIGALWDALWLQPQRLEDEMIQDIRYGLRMLLNNPGFTFVAVFALALGIGANTAIFSVVNAVLLRPLPYPQPEQLMMVFTTSENNGRIERTGPVFGPDFREWQQNLVFEQIGAYSSTWPGNLTGGTEADRVRIGRVTGTLFQTLSVQPILGRNFLPEEEGRPLFWQGSQVTGSTAVLLSHALWQRRFGSDPAVIDRAVRIDGDLCTVVGVMPEGFQFPDEADLWLPATLGDKRDNRFLRVVARLKPGVTQSQAEAEISIIARRLEMAYPETNQGLGVNLVPLHENLVGEVRSSLLIFFGAVVFVLLIACANVGNLLLARSVIRRKEIAIRLGLGATRRRIIRQLLTESLLLGLLGGSFGLLLGYLGLDFLLAFAPQEIPRLNAITVDGWVLGFTLLISMVTGIIFGLAPALQASRPDLNEALKEGSTRASGPPARHRLRGLLVISEVSLALILLIGAGLLLKSFIRLREVNLGFKAENVLTASITLPESTYRTTDQVRAYYQQALQRLSALPEVRAASFINAVPLGTGGARIQGSVMSEGETVPSGWASKLAISPDYFRAMGIPLLKGRAFTERDNDQSPGVLIISESLARRLWPNQEAIGKRLNIGFRDETWREVVGIVGDVKQEDLSAPDVPALYQPYLQVADSRRWQIGEMTLAIQTEAEPQHLASRLRSELRAIDPDLPVYDVALMAQVVSQKVSDPRFYSLLLGSFSALALLLAVAGIYGVISYSVTQRTHEIGIRLALGAQQRDVFKLVILQGMRHVVLGLMLGLAGALALTRVLTEFLFEVSVTDPGIYALIMLLLTGATLLACYVPARRAVKVDPLIALRHE